MTKIGLRLGMLVNTAPDEPRGFLLSEEYTCVRFKQ